MPIGGSPIIIGKSTEDRAWLKAKDGIAAGKRSGVHGVAGGNERIRAIHGHPANCPRAAAIRRGAPRAHGRWIGLRHANNPAMIVGAIAEAAIGDIDESAKQAERTALILRGR